MAMAHQSEGGFLVLSDACQAGLDIPIGEIVNAIEAALKAEAAGKIWTAPKSALLPGDGRYLMTTLSASDAPQKTVVKSVMVSPDNPARGLAGIEGAILLHDSKTGRILALMQSGWVTAFRTAGLSAVAALRLAAPQSRRIAFIGCGVQARSHLETFATLFPLADVTAFGRGQANMDRLCRQAEAQGMTARPCATPAEAVRDADIVVSSVTLSFDLAPFVDARDLKPGAFATITDLAAPWKPDGMAAFETIIIDSMAQEKASATKMVDPALVSGDLLGLVTGDAEVAFDTEKRNAFVFRGLAIGDFAVACLAHERALAAGRGSFTRW
jgi:ornithine cyclodeaminase/alanine dehydrogenase